MTLTGDPIENGKFKANFGESVIFKPLRNNLSGRRQPIKKPVLIRLWYHVPEPASGEEADDFRLEIE